MLSQAQTTKNAAGGRETEAGGEDKGKIRNRFDLVFGALGESLKAFKQEDKEGCIVWEDDPARRVQDGKRRKRRKCGGRWETTGILQVRTKAMVTGLGGRQGFTK